MPSFGSDAIDDALDDDLVELDDEPDARDSETIPKTHGGGNANQQRSSTSELTIGDCMKVVRQAKERHNIDRVPLEVAERVASGEYESVPAALDARRDPEPPVTPVETVGEADGAESRPAAGFDSDTHAPGQAVDDHTPEVEIDAPADAVDQEKIRVLFAEREKVRTFRAEAAERGYKLQNQLGERTARELRALGLRQRVIAYAEELEPLLARTGAGRYLYTDLRLGEIDVGAVDVSDGPGLDDEIKPEPVPVVGIKGYLETGPVVRETVEYTREREGVLPGSETVTRTLAEPVPTEISSRAYRALNGYVEEMGLDLDASKRAAGGASFSADADPSDW